MPGSRPDVKTCWNCADEIPAAADTCETCGAEQSRGAAQAPAGAAPQAKLDIGDLIAGRYEVRGLAAEGTLGGVYKVHDREIDVTLALKLVRPDLVTGEEARKALRASLKKARRFLHKNVIKLYESGEDGGRFFYTMEFVGGINLRKLLQVRAGTRQHFSAAESLPIIEQVASAVEAAHAQGLRHGNLKPENVLILPEGLKLTEFGLTDFVPAKKFLELHKAGHSVQYLAPEHAGAEPLGPRADIYSIGAILYEMLTGAVAGPSAPMASEINESLSDAVDDLLQRCLDADPKKRPASAAEIHKTLQEIVEGGKPKPVTLPPVEAAPPAPKQEPPPPAPPAIEEAHPLDEGAPEPAARAEAGRSSGIRELGAEDGFPVHEAPKDVHFPGEQTLQESMRGGQAKAPAKEAPPPKRTPQKFTAPPPAPDHPFAEGGKSAPSPLPPPSRTAPSPHIPTSPPSAEIVGSAKKGSPVGLIVGAVLLVAALVGGAFFMGIFGGKEEKGEAPVAAVSPPPSAPTPAPPSPPPAETASLPPTEEPVKETPPPPAAKPAEKEAPRPPSPEEEEARAAK
ncbi:MAG: serine/threonine-protein kinase, partial [Bdellovibrionota bacterium]